MLRPEKGVEEEIMRNEVAGEEEQGRTNRRRGRLFSISQGRNILKLRDLGSSSNPDSAYRLGRSLRLSELGFFFWEIKIIVPT